MAFEDLITGLAGEDTPAPIDPELLASRTERKGLTDFSARARQPVDFGADDEVIGPAPKPRRAKAAPAADFGADDEVVDAMYGQTVPTPKARPSEADALTSPVPLPRPRPPAEIQPTQAMPEVQPLEDAPFRAPSSGLTTNMLTGEEAYAEREANIKAAEDTVAEARTRLQAAQERQNAVLAPSTRRGTTGDLQRQAIDAEVENAHKNLSEAELGLSAAQRANPPTQKPIRDAASRFATAVGTIVPDTVGGIARPIDAALDAAGIKNGTGIAEAMREASRRIGIANQPDPTREEDLTAKLGQGAGSAVGFVATGVVGKAAGLPAWAASGVTGAAQNAEQYYREADDMGAPAYKKALAYITGGAIGSTEAVGLGRIADEMDKATGGGVRRYFGLIAKEMGEEGLQEGVQQLLDNIAKYALYGKDPGDITKDVATNALIGAMLGMGMAGTMGAPTLLRGRRGEANIPVPPQAPVSAENIAAQILGESSAPPAQAPAAPQPTPISPAPAAETPADNSALPSNQTENINTPPSPEQAKAVGDSDRAMLRAYGYSDENIDDMSPGQIAAEVAAAEEAGTKPEFGTDDHVVGTRAAPVNIETADDLKAVTNAASGEYTPSQGEANNRPLGHAKWNGLDISIETEAGGIRRGQDPKTKQTWETRMGAAYGYIKGTVGADGMHVDVFMGNKPEGDRVYVIDEVDSETGKFRQHKVMAGFPTEQAARAAYLRTSSKSEKTLGAIADMSIDELKAWLREGDLKAPAVKTRTITLPKQTIKSSEPTSLLQFIASKGGLAPDPELTALDLTGSHRVNIPGRTGRFGVVRPTGMSLDQMREAAEEAGYFRGTANATSTVRDFLDAIDNELRGQRKLPEGQEAEPSKRELQRLDEENAHRAAIEADNRAEIEQMLRDVGIPAGITNEEDIALAARIMADEDMSAEDALELAAMRNLETDLPVTQDQIDDIYDFGAFDAVQPRPTQEDERGAQAESAAGVGPGEEGRTDEPVNDLPRPGEDRQQAQEEPAAGELGQRTGRTEEAGSKGRAADQGVNSAPSEADQNAASRAMEGALDKIEEAVEANDREAVSKAGREARKVLAQTPQFVKDADPEYWAQFKRTISDMLKPGYVTAKQEHDRAIAEGPTWAQVLHKLPMIDDRNRDTDLAFRLMAAITGGPVDKQKFDNLTGPQRHELLKLVSDPFHNPAATKPAPIEKTEAGEQTVLPGAEKIGIGEQAQRKANERLKPTKPQKPADEGLFGDEKDQTDLLDIKPPAQPAKNETTEARESGPSDSEDLDFDSIIDEAIDEHAPEPKASAAAKSAAKNVGMGLAEVAKGLDALFSPKGKLSSGITFDDETYARAKPFFKAGVAHFAEAGRDIKAMLDELVKYLVQTADMDRDAINAMRPYLIRFAQDVRSGAIDLSAQETDNGATESADERSGAESTGEEALDGVSAAQSGGASDAGDAGRGAPGSSDLGAGGDRAAQEPGLSGERGAGSGAAEVHPAASGAGRRRAGARAGGKRGRVSEASASAERSGGEPSGPVTPAEAPNLPALNYRITDETELGQGSEGQKFRDNIAAIETLKTIERENRRATLAEQRALARYVGWGGLANAFRDGDGNFKRDWQERGEQLENLLSNEELTAARRSTRNAHYTSRTVVDAMWDAARHLGFKGGLALELSSGTGNFLGLVPEEITGNTRFIAVEFDSITARIAKALYPQDTVLHSGLHRLPLPEGEAVLNIGNPPFGSESLRFQYKPELSGLSIHNQFFLAGLDALQPGGLQILVVSRYLMDAQDTKAREMIAKKARLLGAIRLPDTAFKENARTEVVTDIIFLQRHTPAEEEYATQQFENSRDPKKSADTPDWVQTATVRDPLGGEDMVVNSYFARKPNMVMGKLERSGSMRQKGEVNVTLAKGADLGAMLRKAIKTLPANVLDLHQEVMDATLKRYQSMGDSLSIALAGHEVGHVEREDGKLYQITERETPTGGYEPVRRPITPDSPWSRQLLMDSGGRWYTLEPKVDAKGAKVKSGARNVYERKYFDGNVVPAAMRLGKAKYDKLSALVNLRDLTKRQLTLEAEDAPAAEMEGNRKKLADAYQSFVSSNGYLNDQGNLRLLNDLPDGALVMALETGYRAPVTNAKAARTGETAKPASAKPAPIMSRRVVPRYEPATKASSPQDALSISLSEVGHADMDRIAQLLGIPRDEAIEQLTSGDKPLLYKDPETGAFDTANGYLSGNVVRKLKAAEAAGLAKNVEALQKVQPERWSAENISAMPGANWIPPQVYADFATHLFGVPARVHYSQVTNSFNLYIDDYSREKADQWGTADMTADAILRGILNSRVPKVVREDGEGKRYVDQEATALVSLKAKEIENEFADWVFADSARRNLLTDIYNEKFNTRVNRQHDGSHLALPGKVPDEVIRLRRHQKNAVWRGIYERFLLLDHVVGAGKTFTAIARVMERRRMGLSRKPMIVVPNHLVDQWTADVYRLYPGAKVLAAGKNQFDKKNRRRLFAKIATGDWDVVIVPHSSFGFIGISPETESRFLEEELRIAKEAVEEAKDQAAADGIGGRTKPFTVKEAERLVTTIEGRLDSLKKASRDNMLTFEQMGVDDLTVDEAHEFKNLFYSSRLTGVRGMGDKSGSQKAFDLYNKVRVLRDSPNGTVTFMTGTPISNSAVEMYTMMRYLAAQDLKDLGIEHFDAWRSQYVSASAKFEPTEAGGLKEVTRLGRNWSNMRALMELYYSFTDAVSQEDINRWYAEDNNGARFPVPKVKTGGRKEVVVKPTSAQSGMLGEIVAGFNSLPNISDPFERNATRLRLMDRARKVSLDVRAADSTVQSDEAGGKLDQIADKIADIYGQSKKDAGTQLVFIDRSVPAAKSDKKVLKDYDDLIGRRDAALAAGDEAQYRDLVEQLDKFDPNEIETLRAAQKGGWNAYDQLKGNLISRGIPADEIRFVQEANNDAEKKALFDSVNDGTVRVLIGSTPRMGAGTNVQERLVALHHGDVTWKPSDIEQREGRIIRQGNKLLEKYGADNFEVDILAYVTERTVDAKMWDLNATKLKMINGIRKYDGAFNMEFEDEDSVGMAEIAALASGDPLLLERVKLMAEIDKLELLERAHRRKMFGIEDAIYDLERAQKNYPAMIEAGKAKAGRIESAIETMRRDAAGRSVEVEGKSYATRLEANNAVEAAIEAQKAGDENARYAININGQRVTNRETAQAVLNEAIGDAVPIEAVVDGDVVRSRTVFGQIIGRKATELLHQTSRDTNKPVRIGKMLGYNLELGVHTDAHRISLALSEDGTTIVDVEQPYAHDAKGFVPQSGRALVDKLEGEIDYEASFTGKRLQDKLDEAETRLPSLREERSKPFGKAEELQGLRDRLEEVIKILDQRTKDAESGRLTEEPRFSIRRRSSSLTGAEIDAPGLLQALQLPHGRFWVDYTRLAKKHPEAFSSPEQVRDHVESVLSAPDVAIPQRSGNIDLVKRSDVDRLIGFRAHLKNGRYQIATAYVLEPGQFERMKSGAAHAGATVLELSSKDHLSGQGRNDEYNRLDAGGQSAPPPMSPQVRANLERALTDVVRKITGPTINVRFVDIYPLKVPPKGWGDFKPDAQTAAGTYLPAEALITVALADPSYPLQHVLDTTFHEAFHALEDRLLTDQEMEVLRREDARLRQIVQQAFGFSNEEIKTIAGFEIRAMAFEYYASMRARGLHAPGVHIGIRKAFERLMEIFRRVGNYLRGLGYQNADDILRAAYDGAYSGRAGGRTAGAEQANIRGQVRPHGNLNRFESYDPLPERWQDWWKRPDLNWRDRVWGMIDAAFLKANRALGDRYVDMRRMQAAVELAGRRVTEGIDMALAATLFEGRTEKRLKDYWLKTWRPVLAEIAEMGVSREELHEYLYARHAPERNRHIADINPLMPDGGSGMTNDEAQAVMDRFEADGKRELMERAAQKIDAIVRRIRATMVADQLEHEETISGWEQAYQYYVPLQGFESGDEDMASPIRRGTGFDVRGPETKAALGRSSKADDILSNLFLMGERTIIRGEQNRVGRTAMRFMQSNPQPSLYDVQRTERILADGRTEAMTENDIDLLMGERAITVQRRNPHTGLVESVTRVASAFAKDSFAVKVGGHTYYIRIKHPDLLTALKNVGVERLPALIRAHGWLTRQFAAFRTARNPDFFVANLFRDIQDAAFTVTAEQRAEFLKHFAANIGTLRSYVGAVMGEMMEADNVAGDFARRRFVEKRWAQLHQDWKKNGGQIAFMGIHDLDQAKREIESAFNETKEGYLKSVAMFPGRTAKNLLKAIEFFNGTIEAGTRLAVYDAALKAGMTKAQAAQLSKEATTNFNRKGIYSPFLGSFYAFFNARVQGGLKTIRMLRTSKVARRAAIGLAVGGFATTLWNLAVSPDDEDKKPEYMKRKYWERERYFIFYMPGSKEPFRIPMGYGLQLFWMLGENLAMVSQGKITSGAAAANYLSTIVGAFSPVSAEGSAMDVGTWLRTIMPSIEMPLLELTINENWRRKPIHPKFGAKGEPHSEQPFTTTSPFAIDVARFLNQATGGDAFRPGAVDLYPGDVQYVWEFATGGLGQTVNRTATMLNNWAEGVPTPANQIPIVRHFVGANVEQQSGEAFYEDREKVQKGMAQVRKAMKADINGPQGDAAAETIEKGGNEFGVKQGKRKGTVSSDAEKIFRDADKELKDLRRQEKAARNDPSMDRKARADLIAIIRENMRQVQEEARKAYREIKQREAAF
ncbi:LPD38 domain-containing protein [Bradyrhizobium sp. sGM-13]|uniref:LPD38 domain-containing protein n=1 Tax=Bradyrhizobium sp. sGM-13 TaxID=2831781 RepID=UPI001BD14C8D|nr:LPD38 domain-containing protein [Bradyrhizobium sp. sGM-13]